jgi:hypothetical protein
MRLPEFEYKQRPTTREYLENWERIFNALEAPAEVQAPTPLLDFESRSVRHQEWLRTTPKPDGDNDR